MKKRIIMAICLAATKIAVIVCIILAYFNSNYYYSTKLVDAIENQSIPEIKQILEKKPSCINTLPTCMPTGLYILATDRSPSYPLMYACRTDNIDIMKLLIENGADVNCNNGGTPLSYTYVAKNDNWYEISVLLIESGADLNYITESSGGKSSVLCDIVKTRSGSALADYVPENNDEVMTAFNYAMKHCDHSNVNWMRVLQHSVSNDRIEIVKLLLDQGYCDVNDTSVGMTALMFAARDSSPEMVELLLDKGADKSLKLDGKTALDYAIESGDENEEIIALLSD